MHVELERERERACEGTTGACRAREREHVCVCVTERYIATEGGKGRYRRKRDRGILSYVCHICSCSPVLILSIQILCLSHLFLISCLLSSSCQYVCHICS